MNILTNLLMMTTIIVFIIDLSGIVTHIKTTLWKIFMPGKRPYEHFSLKPFDCSLCTTWWAGLAYLLLSGNLSLFNVLLVSLCAFYSANIAWFLIALQDLLGWITTMKNK